MWGTVLSELPHGAARAEASHSGSWSEPFQRPKVNLVSLAYLEYWAKATYSLLSEPKIANMVKPQYHHCFILSCSPPEFYLSLVLS